MVAPENPSRSAAFKIFRAACLAPTATSCSKSPFFPMLGLNFSGSSRPCLHELMHWVAARWSADKLFELICSSIGVPNKVAGVYMRYIRNMQYSTFHLCSAVTKLPQGILHVKFEAFCSHREQALRWRWPFQKAETLSGSWLPFMGGWIQKWGWRMGVRKYDPWPHHRMIKIHPHVLVMFYYTTLHYTTATIKRPVLHLWKFQEETAAMLPKYTHTCCYDMLMLVNNTGNGKYL